VRQHQIVHSGERRFKCETCDKKFSMAANLCSHQLVHTCERRFACDMCDKTFTCMSLLRRHKFLHTGERPQVCEVCKNTFSEASSLRAHMHTHTGHMPYVYETCNRKFAHFLLQVSLRWASIYLWQFTSTVYIGGGGSLHRHKKVHLKDHLHVSIRRQKDIAEKLAKLANATSTEAQAWKQVAILSLINYFVLFINFCKIFILSHLWF